ncbi:MAG: hypothetical protein FJ288_09670 [Planctomycetes bacterium]|nr:hypothetical protein [Planctomycetota bacterium]
MTIEVSCGTCGRGWAVAEELAGRPIACPGCGAAIPVPPAPGAAAGAPRQPEVVLTLSQAGALANLRMAAVFNIVAGIVSVLMAGLLVFYAVMFATMGMRTEMPLDSPPVFKILIGFSAVAALLSLASGAVQILGGTYLAMRRPGARTLGLIAGFASCVSVWGYCVYPLCLAAGIYTVIVLFRRETREMLEASAG